MNIQKAVRKSLLAAAGYVLSPLSWWYDLYVNFPIAYVMAWITSFLDKKLFFGSLVVFYWSTNIAGLVMLHKGLVPGEVAEKKNRLRAVIVQDILISIIYTAVIMLFMHYGILKMPQEYLPH